MCYNLHTKSNSIAGSQDDIPPPPPPPPSQTPTQQTPHTVSTIKLPILKKGEYDIWAMKMEHYLAHTDYPIWEVIQNGNGPVQRIENKAKTIAAQRERRKEMGYYPMCQGSLGDH
ncbi:hypothetical protein Tco_0617080 [Tanacetum coccineum]